MISLPNIESGIQRFPNAGAWNKPELQPSFSVVNTPAGPRFRFEWCGDADKLLEMQLGDEMLQPGSISFPTSSGISAGNWWVILENTDLQGEEGASATLRAEYRRRNKRETDEDVAAGLQSRDIGARWIERQEVLEHYLSRKAAADAAGSQFNGTLFALWLQEADPEAKMDFSVTQADGTVVALDDTDAGGSDLTKAAAQRFAMGVQYASQRILQVEVSETWRTPPDIDAQCNVILATGIPEKHKPLFKVVNFEGKFAWMRAADSVLPLGGSQFRRQVVYLGVPNSMKPADPPAFWGDGPIDALLYRTVERED